jgi:hypothetical protein
LACVAFFGLGVFWLIPETLYALGFNTPANFDVDLDFETIEPVYRKSDPEKNKIVMWQV